MEGIHTTRSWVSTDLNGDIPTLLPEDSEIIIKGETPIMLPEKEKGKGGLSFPWVSAILMSPFQLRIVYNSLW